MTQGQDPMDGSTRFPTDEPAGAAMERLGADLVRWRRMFHSRPEPGWCEYWTTAEMAGRLARLGLAVHVGAELGDTHGRLGLPAHELMAAFRRSALGPLGSTSGADPLLVRRMGRCTGFVADLPATGAGADEAPGLVIRCDLDALPVAESALAGHRPTREGFASRNPGFSHACGHDGHMAILLGVATLVAPLACRLRRSLRLVGQPAEEGVRGARFLAHQVAGAGAFVGYHIGLGTPSGTIVTGVSGGFATTKFDVDFTGRAAHAATDPEHGRNALLGAAQAILGLQSMAIPASGEGRIAVGVCRAGSARNVVPDFAHLECEVRGYPDTVDAFLLARAREVVAGAAAMQELRHRFTVRGHAGCLDSDASLAAELADVARAACPGEPAFPVVCPSGRMPASEDAATLMHAVAASGGRAAYVLFGSRLAGGHHTATFDFEEEVLLPAALFLARVVRRFCL